MSLAGAARGIGLACASCLGHEGCKVVVADVDDDASAKCAARTASTASIQVAAYVPASARFPDTYVHTCVTLLCDIAARTTAVRSASAKH